MDFNTLPDFLTSVTINLITIRNSFMDAFNALKNERMGNVNFYEINEYSDYKKVSRLNQYTLNIYLLENKSDNALFLSDVMKNFSKAKLELICSDCMMPSLYSISSSDEIIKSVLAISKMLNESGLVNVDLDDLASMARNGSIFKVINTLVDTKMLKSNGFKFTEKLYTSGVVYIKGNMKISLVDLNLVLTNIRENHTIGEILYGQGVDPSVTDDMMDITLFLVD